MGGIQLLSTLIGIVSAAENVKKFVLWALFLCQRANHAGKKENVPSVWLVCIIVLWNLSNMEIKQREDLDM
jgi:hypothetical protein